MPENIDQLNKKFASLNLREAFEALASEQFKNPAFSTSFGNCQAESIEIDEGKYTRYSDLLVQLVRMKQAKDKQV